MALDLLGSLLELRPDPKPILLPEPRALFDSWHYQEIVRKSVPNLVGATGVRALDLLCDILDSALQLSTKDQDGEGSEDYSSIWRPASTTTRVHLVKSQGHLYRRFAMQHSSW